LSLLLFLLSFSFSFYFFLLPRSPSVEGSIKSFSRTHHTLESDNRQEKTTSKGLESNINATEFSEQKKKIN